MQNFSLPHFTPPPMAQAALVRMGWIGRHAERAAVGTILLLFFLFGFWYSLLVPPFETPDEDYHYAFARHLSQGNGLPVQTTESSGPWEHEGTQAPLYYFLVGRLIAGIDQSDFDQIRVINPHGNLGDPLFPGNKNRMLYSARSLPLVGTNLAMHVGRWFSLLLGMITLCFAYGIARLALPGSRLLPLLVLLTVAAIPQFQFISATVSNDNLAIMLSTATLFWLARLLVRADKPADKPIVWHEWLVLGLLLGLAALSKLHALGLFLLSGGAVLGMAWLQRDRWLPIRAGLLILIPALLIAGWWYWRNYTLYGEWLGVNQLLTINGLRAEPRTLDYLVGELRGVRYSFWGLFGWFSILLPYVFYISLDVLTIVVVVGLLVGWLGAGRQKLTVFYPPHRRVQLLLLVWALMLIGLMFYWLTFATSGQGRLLFPAISAYGLLIISGLGVWIQMAPPPWRLFLFLILPAGLFASSFYALTILLPASYQAPTALASVPPQATPYHVVYGIAGGDEIELLAFAVDEGRYQPGDEVNVTLYMRTASPIQSDYTLFVQLLGPDDLVVGNVTTHPGWGRLPTSLWEPGKIYADRYRVAVWDNVSNRSPLLAQVLVGFVDPTSHLTLPIHTPDGLPLEQAYLSAISVVANQPLDPSLFYLLPSDADFSQQIRLIGYEYPSRAQVGQDRYLPVTLLWEAIASPAQEYTAFVHLIDEDGSQVSGFDQPPAEGRFPTSYWQAGDRSLSKFVIDIPSHIPPGSYALWVGLYADTAGMERLPIFSTTHEVVDQRVLLGFLLLQ